MNMSEYEWSPTTFVGRAICFIVGLAFTALGFVNLMWLISCIHKAYDYYPQSESLWAMLFAAFAWPFWLICWVVAYIFFSELYKSYKDRKDKR